MKSMKKLKNVGVLILVLFFAVYIQPVMADITVDLTSGDDLGTNASGTINGAIFEWTDFSSTGTGLIDPFLKIEQHANNTTEQGYNSDDRSYGNGSNKAEFDAIESYDHSLPVFTVPIVEKGGDYYLEFLLDVDQKANLGGTLISLDKLEIYETDDPDLHDYNTGWGTPVYSLDEGGNNNILLDASKNDGSGSGDMFAYIPLDDFSYSVTALGKINFEYKYLCLYSYFSNTNDGPEEWAIRLNTGIDEIVVDPVPVPAAVLLGILGMTVAGVKLRKHV